MKKTSQNILAQNSNNDIAYLCGRCGKEIDKEATICLYCGAKLGNIKCPFCNFEGTINDFKMDTCPKCGRENKIDNSISKNIFKTKEHNFSKKLFWILFFTLLILLGVLSFIFLYKFDLI